jgi:hypothetical protein
MRLKRQVGRWLIIALCAAASVTLPAMFCQDIENLLVETGIQQDILDPILGLFGPLGGLFTS